MTLSSTSTQTVLVTGANGYLALHIIDRLLQSGYNVRGTVRSNKAKDKVRTVFPHFWGHRLEVVFVTDLTKPEAYDDALDSKVTAVIHAASPVHGTIQDNVQDMLDPAVKGATAILEAVSRINSSQCRRVVHLSSFSAMLDTAKGFRPGYTYTEKDWNPVTFDEAAVIENSSDLYLASKSLSERAVWRWASERKPGFDIVCINPSFVVGPHLDTMETVNTTSTGAMLWSIIDAEAIPTLFFGGCVDVRDVATMMQAALEVPEAAGQRFLVAQHFDWQTAADVARGSFAQLKGRIPVGDPGSGRRKALDHIYEVDGTKAIRTLGVGYRLWRKRSETLYKRSSKSKREPGEVFADLGVYLDAV